MRSGYGQRLRDEVQRVDSVAGLIAEVAIVGGSDIRTTRAEWATGTRTNVDILNGGGVALSSTATERISHQAETDPTDIVRLTNGSPFDGLLIEWYGSSARNREIRNLTARLHPRLDAGEAKEVAAWVCEIFRVTRIGDDDISVQLLRRREVEATGEVAGDVTFTFGGFNGTYPRVGDPPEGSGTGRPMTLVRVVAIQADGTIADNVSWIGSSTGGDSQSDAGVYDARHVTVSDLPPATGVTEWFMQEDRDDLPLFVMNEATYEDGDVEFADSGDFDDLEGSGDIRVVLRGTQPSDSEIRGFIWSGAAYVRCYDGDIVGQDNRITIDGVEFGGDLSGVPTTGPWDMRVNLDASSDGQSTPTVRDFGLERLSVTPLVGAARVSGGGQRISDLTALKGSIANATVEIAKSGEQDYDDYGSRVLAQNHIGQMEIRLWFGDLTGTRLARSEWMLHSIWEINDYDNTASAHVVQVLSPLRRLRKVVPPFVTVGEGPGGERAAVALNDDIAGAWSEVVDTLAALPSRYIGTGPADEATTIADTIRKADAKDLLDAIAYLDGSANIESQGRIKAVRIMHDDPADEAVAFQLPLGSYEPGKIGPGFDARTDEFFVRYNWNEANGAFEDERRHANLAALENLGGPGLNTTQELRDEVSRLIRTEALADAVGRRVPKHFGTGELRWHVRPLERMPHIEIGDVGVIETELFVARSPINGRELRGPLATLAVVVGYDDAEGRGLWLWVPSYELIQSTSAEVDRSALREPALDLSVASIKMVPKPGLGVTGVYYIEIPYHGVGADVDRVEVTWYFFDPTGEGDSTLTYDLLASGSATGTLDLDGGRHRLRGGGGIDQEFFLTDESMKVTLVPESADGIRGVPVVVDIGDLDEVGSGAAAEASGGGVILGDYFVPGTNVTIDVDGAGRPKINASGGGGGASELDDLSDVAITSPADGEALLFDSGDWVNRDLATSDIRSGAFGLARGGTGRSSVTAGNLIVGAGDGTSAMTLLAPGLAGGFVRSNGSAWVRSAIQASDVPNLPASRITSGTFDEARIPNLNASKITDGTFDPALISQTGVTQHQGALAIAASQVTSGTFAIARIPSIPVSSLTPGTLSSSSWLWRGADGTAGAPALSFNSDTNTGFYRVGENILGVATAGTFRGQFDTTGLKLLAGSASAPSLANTGFTNYGLYFASGVVGLSVAGTSRARATTSGFAVTGTITAVGDVQSSVSDARLKTEVVPIDGALERVGRLHGVYHRYTDEALDRWPELKSRRRAALIAQDVAEVLPEAVVPFAGDPEYLNYLPEMVIPLLVEAIHEMQDRLDALETRRAA